MPISRRVLIGAAVTLAATEWRPPPAGADEPIKEADKIKQADAKYQKEPKGQQRCEICLQFQPPASCKIVQGPITPQGWCQFFAAKENAH
ncbi:MAG: hypothetical protein ACREFH_05950 [Stellaceae bacterium]